MSSMNLSALLSGNRATGLWRSCQLQYARGGKPGCGHVTELYQSPGLEGRSGHMTTLSQWEPFPGISAVSASDVIDDHEAGPSMATTLASRGSHSDRIKLLSKRSKDNRIEGP